MEKIYNLANNIDTLIFYGVNNCNIRLLSDMFPNLKLVARGYTLKILGEDIEVNHLVSLLEKIEKYYLESNSLDEKSILKILKGNELVIPKEEHFIVHGVGGKTISARTSNQKKMLDDFEKNDLLFAVGPAGSGKTYTAIALAVMALKAKIVKKIILSRPAVEAGEKLGFLPGDMKEKIDPYLQPLYDALQDMIPPAKLTEYMEKNIIQIAPLAFMRGRTLNEAVVILDEAQNTSVQQIKMFLTRMGIGSKMIVTGDMTQIDLPYSQKSGLIDAIDVLSGVKGISIVRLNQNDIVRHFLVQRIVEAYDHRKKELK